MFVQMTSFSLQLLVEQLKCGLSMSKNIGSELLFTKMNPSKSKQRMSLRWSAAFSTIVQSSLCVIEFGRLVVFKINGGKRRNRALVIKLKLFDTYRFMTPGTFQY
jgi:hypothetical protein